MNDKRVAKRIELQACINQHSLKEGTILTIVNYGAGDARWYGTEMMSCMSRHVDNPRDMIR